MKYLLIVIIAAAGIGFCWKNDLNSLDDLMSYIQKEEYPSIDTEHSYRDVESAFRKDELFAVLSKEFIPPQTYDKIFQKTRLGGQATGTYPAVYTIKCLGRETRETYIFIIGYRFYNQIHTNQKLTRHELGLFQKYLSEADLRDDLFHKRFRFQMID
jgi:hypothetical protein